MLTLSNPCHLPLIANRGTEKLYCCLDSFGKLQLWLYKGENWHLQESNLFNHYLCAFDGAVDEQGLLHLLGYDTNGNFYHGSIDLSGRLQAPRLLFSGQGQNIYQLSCCFDPLQQLHILYLAAEEDCKQQQLFYLRHPCRDGQTKPFLVDTTPGLYCCILSDRQNHIYMICPMIVDGRMRLALRSMDLRRERPGRAYLFPGILEGTCWPSTYCDGQNNIHISWVSRHQGNSRLNYIRRDGQGEWQNFLQMAVPPDTSAAAPLSSNGNDLFLFYYFAGKLGFLYSRDGGISWKRGKDEPLPGECVLTRMRAGGDAGGRIFDKQEFFFISNVPTPERKETAAKEDEASPAVEDTPDSLNLLTSYVFTRIYAMEEDNRTLAQKLAQKEKELAMLQEREQSMLQDLETMLREKTLRFNEMELLLKESLRQYVEKINGEKAVLREQIDLLRMDIIKLQDSKRSLLRENISLRQKINHYMEKEKALPLTGEKTNSNLYIWFRERFKPLWDR